MPDNKITILQRLEAGEIRAEEALNLMQQSEAATVTHDSAHVDPRQVNPNRKEPRDYYHPDFHRQGQEPDPDWANSIVSWVSDLVEEISGGISDLEVGTNLSDIISGTYSHNKRTVAFTSQPVLQGLAQLEISGKNDKVEIYAYDGDTVQIHCDYNARRPDSYVQFHEENGHIALWFDNKAMRSVRVICQVPRVHVEQLSADTKNGRIFLGDITARDIRLATKNETILLDNISCGSLNAVTTNDNIKAAGLSGENIHLETTNAKITAEGIHAHSLTLKTTNAAIKTAGMDVEHLAIKTTNARLKLEDTYAGLGHSFWDQERALEAYTTNGGIRFTMPGGTGLNLEAHTTDSRVTCEVPLYRADGGSKNHLVGESVDYASAARRLRVKLATTNASIKIWQG